LISSSGPVVTTASDPLFFITGNHKLSRPVVTDEDSSSVRSSSSDGGGDNQTSQIQFGAVQGHE
jgi:hypothetical protein